MLEMVAVMWKVLEIELCGVRDGHGYVEGFGD